MTTTTFIALLRGINVGGKNRLRMTDLVALFGEAGCANARTYIQSGNVIFTAPRRASGQLPSLIAGLIAKRHGIKSPVVLRTAGELAEAAANNPFIHAGADPAHLYLAFLADAPPQKRAAMLDPARSPGDSFHLRGRDLYLHLTNGVARSKLTNAYLDSTLATTSTVRNWRTVLELCRLVGAGAAPGT